MTEEVTQAKTETETQTKALRRQIEDAQEETRKATETNNALNEEIQKMHSFLLFSLRMIECKVKR